MKQFLLILLLSLSFAVAYSSPQQSASRDNNTKLSAIVPSEFATELVATMRTYIGERETSVNSSPNIDRWARITGVPLESYWCVTFTYGTAEETENRTGIENPLPRTGSVSRMLAYAKSYGSNLQVISTRQYGNLQLITGDIGCMKSGRRFGDSDIGALWNGHQYTVQYQARDGRLRSIEGNGNAGGSRNGDRVVERWRDARGAVAFIRIQQPT